MKSEVVAFFRCDPDGLKKILSEKPFERRLLMGMALNKLDDHVLSGLKGLPSEEKRVAYVRSDITDGFCYVITDSLYSFAYVYYSAD